MQKPTNLIFVIFGASGDLARRKLLPALYALFRQQMLPAEFIILGVGRKPLSDAEFANSMAVSLGQTVPPSLYDKEAVQQFCLRLAFHVMDTTDITHFGSLKIRLESLSHSTACQGRYLYYYAVPPVMYVPLTRGLYQAGLTCETEGWKRVVVEKPFGRDWQSAVELNKELLTLLKEEQIYRIDHYLGKETVQNILVTRFSNSIFEPLWNRNYVDYIEITSAESLGVGSRAGYYDTAGALRDMLQNHLMQLLAIVAMEPPVSAEATDIRNEMLKVFRSLRRMKPEEVSQRVVRGQYVASHIRGVEQPAYREEEGISQDSKTETYVALKCYVDNWRWSGVPFFVRSGKAMPTQVTEVVIHFKPNPHRIFARRNEMESAGNALVIRIQPDEGLLLRFGMKVPGSGFQVDRVNMDFHYSSLNHTHIPLAYERLLSDAMLGDATLFQRNDAVEATWQFVQPILEAWQHEDFPLYGYPAGTWGPEQADALLAADGFEWRYPCKNLADDGTACEL